jgi:hypothetical protein
VSGKCRGNGKNKEIKRMKKSIAILVAGLLLSAELPAQKVYKDAGRVILELTVEAGMPAGTMTGVPKVWTGTPDNYNGPLPENGIEGSINAKVFRKLEVAPYDMNKAGALNANSTGNDLWIQTWANAFDGCRNLVHNGSGWRLPTARELALMVIFKPALDDLCDKALTNDWYWSATEYEYEQRDAMLVKGFLVVYIQKVGTEDEPTHARCVREIL